VRIAGRLTTAGEYVSSLDSRITWAALGANKDIVAAETETHAGNARRTGAAPLTPSPKPGALAWSAPLGRSASSEMAMHFWPEDNQYPHWQPFPVVAGGRVFNSTFEGIQCLDSASGQAVWKQNWISSGGLWADKFTGFPISCPTATAERVYLRVLAGAQSALRCYRAGDGKLLWSTEANAGLKKTVWLSDPLVAGGLAVAVFLEEFPQGDGGVARNGYNVHGVAAFDAESGDLRWKRALAAGVTGIRVCEEVRGRDNRQYTAYRGSMQLGPPATDGSVIYAPTGLGSLAALNAFTGEVLWLAGYPRLRCDDLQNGTSGALPFVPRMLKINARGPCSPIVADDVIVLAPKDATGILAFDRKDGRIRWARDLDDSRFLVGLSDGNLIAADSSVSAISLGTGRTVWQFALEKRLLGQPGYSGGIVYSPTQGGVQLVDAHTGKALESVAWDKKIGALANLVVTGQRIVGVNAKYVAALSAK
jgi:outer membrane protein assembly factor BamB